MKSFKIETTFQDFMEFVYGVTREEWEKENPPRPEGVPKWKSKSGLGMRGILSKDIKKRKAE